jgi:hypothetical protein
MQRTQKKDREQRPTKAPIFSQMPSTPKALLRAFSSAEDAMSASRGADRGAAPHRSRSRAPKTPCQIVQRRILLLVLIKWRNAIKLEPFDSCAFQYKLSCSP